MYIFNGRKQTLVDTSGIRDTVSAAHALRMRGLHDKRQLLAKLRIAGSEKSARNQREISEKFSIATMAALTILFFKHTGRTEA